MKRLAIFATLLVGSFALVSCADGPERDDSITCYSGGELVIADDQGSVQRVDEGVFRIERQDGTVSTYSMDCSVDWSSGAPTKQQDN